MPDGPLFAPSAGPVEACRQSGKAKARNWDMDCIRKIYCPTHAAELAKIGTLKITKVDDLYWTDDYFDGKSWGKKKFPGAGGQSGKEIVVLSKMSCEEAADTLYHETWHAYQPAGMGWPHPAEDDAYYNTELWLIKAGLPGNPGLRTKDAKGAVVPDKAAIGAFVNSEYPSATGPGAPQPIGFDPKKNTTTVEDSKGVVSTRPSKKGDSLPGPQTRVNEKVVPSKEFKCP